MDNSTLQRRQYHTMYAAVSQGALGAQNYKRFQIAKNVVLGLLT